MVLCTNCKKRPAVVFITTMHGSEKRNEGLCLVCAKKLNIPQVAEYMEHMGITDEDIEQMSDQMMDLMEDESFQMGGASTLPNFIQKMLRLFNEDKVRPSSTSTIVHSLDSKKDPFRLADDNEEILEPEVPYLKILDWTSQSL